MVGETEPRGLGTVRVHHRVEAMAAFAAARKLYDGHALASSNLADEAESLRGSHLAVHHTLILVELYRNVLIR